MKIREIVAAMVEGHNLTTCTPEIVAFLAAGRHLQFISRKQAEQQAVDSPSRTWSSLSLAPTLFLLDNGVRFRRVSHEPLMNANKR